MFHRLIDGRTTRTSTSMTSFPVGMLEHLFGGRLVKALPPLTGLELTPTLNYLLSHSMHHLLRHPPSRISCSRLSRLTDGVGKSRETLESLVDTALLLHRRGLHKTETMTPSPKFDSDATRWPIHVVGKTDSTVVSSRETLLTLECLVTSTFPRRRRSPREAGGRRRLHVKATLDVETCI